ncbi:MAG: hypothetical protein JXB00_12365 [Bacteroidales bacterium]|nr:hypothetical protein [Bacteroidales bacterium]
MRKVFSYLIISLLPFLLKGQADSVFLNSLTRANLGIIADPDNYSIVRAYPDIHSDSVNYIANDEFFDFIPDPSSDWLAVYKHWNTFGYVHKSRIIGISSLSDAKIISLSYKIIKEQLRIAKEFDRISFNERERFDSIGSVYNNYHDSYFRPFLNYAVDFMIKSGDTDLIKLLVNVIYYSTGSADETQSFEFARLVVAKPELLLNCINEYKSVSLNEYTLGSVDFYASHGFDIDEKVRKMLRAK